MSSGFDGVKGLSRAKRLLFTNAKEQIIKKIIIIYKYYNMEGDLSDFFRS